MDAGAHHAVALIPGISLTPDGAGSHAFVQLIQAGGDTAYWEYPAEEFRFATDRFEIEVGPNHFSPKGIRLDAEGEAGRLTGELRFGEWTGWPVRPLSPGIMGWYRFVPFMETYHGVLGLDHSVDGELEIDGAALGDYRDLVVHYRALESHPVVWLLTPPTLFRLGRSATVRYGMDERALVQMCAAIKEIARDLGCGLIDINAVTAGHPEAFRLDGVHPGAAGARLIAWAVFDVVAGKWATSGVECAQGMHRTGGRR